MRSGHKAARPRAGRDLIDGVALDPGPIGFAAEFLASALVVRWLPALWLPLTVVLATLLAYKLDRAADAGRITEGRMNALYLQHAVPWLLGNALGWASLFPHGG